MIVEPGTGSLDLTTSDAIFVNSGDMRLVLTGIAPSVTFNVPVITVPVASLAFTEGTPARLTGLTFESTAPTIGVTVSLSAGSLALTGRVPQLFQSPPETVVPETAELAFTGNQANVLTQSETVPVGSLSLTGQSITAVINTSPAHPFFASLVISTEAPTIEVANSGTSIQNLGAGADTGNRYNICDRSGFKAKPGELVREWTGNWVLPEYAEPRNMQDFVAVKGESQRGALRPEPVGSEIFVEDVYPNGVDSDDDL